MTALTSNATAVGKRTTVIYAEGGHNPLFKCVSRSERYVNQNKNCKTVIVKPKHALVTNE